MSPAAAPQALGDFAALLVREVAQALLLAREAAPFVEVRSLKLRLGQQPADAEDNAHGIILSERYPLLQDGWQLELELDNRVRARLGGQELQLESSGRTALDLFGDRPLDWLKGIDRRWQQRLADNGIKQLRQLAELSDTDLQQLQSRYRSLRLREFRAKARLLETPLPPLPTGKLAAVKLYRLLQYSEQLLAESFGRQRVAQSELQRFSALLDALCLSLDAERLEQVSLQELLNG